MIIIICTQNIYRSNAVKSKEKEEMNDVIIHVISVKHIQVVVFFSFELLKQQCHFLSFRHQKNHHK